MAPFYYGTERDDIIDGRELPEEYSIIDALAGDDTVYLGAHQIFAAGPGSDTIHGNGNSAYALWSSPEEIYINLAEGYAIDGFGETDYLTGISSVHMTSFGGTVIGSSNDEEVVCFGNDSYIDLGSGDDIVVMWEQDSADYKTRHIDGVWYLNSEESLVELHGTETVEFQDKTYINPTSNILYSNPYTAHSFIETEWTEGHFFDGDWRPPFLVDYSAQIGLFLDIGNDNDLDLIIPIGKGYRTGIDTRLHSVVLENIGGELHYNEEMSLETPFITQPRQIEAIHLDRYNSEAYVTIGSDTARTGETRYDIPWRLGDIAIITVNPFEDVTAQLVPENTLPSSELVNRDTAVEAHSLAVGDINNDGLDDILVGEYSSPFVLIQTPSGSFDYHTSNFYAGLHGHLDPYFDYDGWGFLLELKLEDMNGDGADDLIAGWAEGVESRVFFNNGLDPFSFENSISLPPSLYGTDNSNHLKTFAQDFDCDGDLDLLIQHAQAEPWYGGFYLQYLDNVGSGSFTDLTVERLGDPALLDDTFSEEKLNWHDICQVFDADGDGDLDIFTCTTDDNNFVLSPLAYLNDGSGYFTMIDYPSISGDPFAWRDLDNDSNLEMIAFELSWTDDPPSSSLYQFNVYDMQTINLQAARAYDLNGNAGLVAKTIGAVLGPDAVSVPQYVGIGLHYVDEEDYSLEELIEFALDAVLGDEADNNDAVVDLLYSNVVGVAPSQEAHDHYVGLLENGEYTPSSLGVMAAETELNQANINLVGLSDIGLEYIPYA